MKKLIVLGLFALTGCASVSEYNQGCRDGVNEAIADLGKVTAAFGVEVKAKNVDENCSDLDRRHKEKPVHEKN